MNITVYCSSSGALQAHFSEGARTVGSALAAAGLTMVYGGGSTGLMGECARAAKAGGGRVIGITTGKLDSLEHGWRGCDELQVVETMPERKTRMMDLADGYVVLPGGLGTYEEFFEVLVARQLGDHSTPIVIVNHDGYYDPLIAMIEHGIEHRFTKINHPWTNGQVERMNRTIKDATVRRFHYDETSDRVSGESWHSDQSCAAIPPLGSKVAKYKVPAELVAT